MNFRLAKDQIYASPIFKILQKMPKGAILHVHSLHDVRFLIRNGSYRTDCYINQGKSSTRAINGGFLYSSNPPTPMNGEVWQNVEELRKKQPNVTVFDELLYQSMQFYTPTNGTQDLMWENFDEVIRRYEFFISFSINF